MGSGVCWVCEGSGYADPERQAGTCASCGGTGRCRLCQPTRPPKRAGAARQIDVRDAEVVGHCSLDWIQHSSD
jgi:hypothetical protein